jgi:uncharacterized membrane protein YeaQ/YmgE (transglycosylase-associated protein family)
MGILRYGKDSRAAPCFEGPAPQARRRRNIRFGAALFRDCRSTAAISEKIVRDPTVTFLLVLGIGIVLGILFDRFAGRSWLPRKFAGTGGMVTSALVGVAGSFIGFHLATLFKQGAGAPRLIGAALGALVVLWLWRMTR